jgi:hypothetical protein
MNTSEGDGRQIDTSRRHHSVRVSVNLFLLLTFLLTACGMIKTTPHPSLRPSLASQVDTFLTHEVEAEQFSGSVLIARAGKVLFSQGYSLADWDHRVPNTPQTEFRIGSLTLRELNGLDHEPVMNEATLPVSPTTFYVELLFGRMFHSWHT